MIETLHITMLRCQLQPGGKMQSKLVQYIMCDSILDETSPQYVKLGTICQICYRPDLQLDHIGVSSTEQLVTEKKNKP